MEKTIADVMFQIEAKKSAITTLNEKIGILDVRAGH